MLIIMFFVWGCLGIAIWFAAIAAMYAAFTTSYLLCAWGWQAWKMGKRLWIRS